MSDLVAYLVLFGVALTAGFGGGLAFALLLAWRAERVIDRHVTRLGAELERQRVLARKQEGVA